MSIVILRRSTCDDINAIDGLMHECFGERNREEYLKDVDSGRYLLATVNDKVVGMSGIYPTGNYFKDYPEFDWTCVSKKYRRHGIMTELVYALLDNFHGRVYYDAWRVHGNERSNAQSVLERVGFKCLELGREHWINGVTCRRPDSKSCVNYTGCNCECYDDIWYIDRD